MVRTIKRTLGFVISILALPCIFGLLSLDGQICLYGNCKDAIPFWGGVLFGLEIYLGFITLGLLIWLIVWLFTD